VARAKRPLFRIGAAVAATMAVAGLAAGCGADPDGTGDGASANMEHIHGLGIDPADGTVYAGTHYGLFRIDADGTADRVAGRVQDFMGFTVAGPDTFLASGHPGEGQGGPSSVGLVESTDAGETWQELSLSGDADFHALEYRHGKVYGFNAMTGRLLMSEDMKSWQEIARVALADFAVSPEDASTLVATTEQGLAVTTDNGKTFAAVDGAPLMVFVSWADDGTLAGVTPDGVVYTSPDPAGPWTGRGSLGGQPEALTAATGKEIYAAAHGTVLRSRDGGDTFTALYPR